MTDNESMEQEPIDAVKRRTDELGRRVQHQIALEQAVFWDIAEACERVYLEQAELKLAKEWFKGG